MNWRWGSLAFVFWLLWVALNTSLFEKSPALLVYCLIVGLVAWAPGLYWLKRGAPCLPVMETYCGFHLIYYVHPVLEQRKLLFGYPLSVQYEGITAVLVFLLALQAVFYFSLGRTGGRVRRMPMFSWLYALQMPSFRRSLVCWMMLWAWVGYEVALHLRWLPDMGLAFRPVQLVFQGMGAFSVYCLCFAMGRRDLTDAQILALVVAFGTYAVLELSSGFLSGVGKFSILGLLAYIMSARRIPITAITVMFLAFAFLHAGKGAVRDEFWSHGRNYSATVQNPVRVLAFWTVASWNRITSSDPQTEVPRILDRGSLSHMLARAMTMAPERVPYLEGETYAQLPYLLIPRLVWPEKPRGTWPSETLAIHFGVQTRKSVEFTSVGMGQIAEGWANFGWLGVAGAGAVFGFFLSIPARLSYAADANTARSIVAASGMIMAADLEHCLAQWVVVMTNAIIASLLLVFFLARQRIRAYYRLQQAGVIVSPSATGVSAADVSRQFPRR